MRNKNSCHALQILCFHPCSLKLIIEMSFELGVYFVYHLSRYFMMDVIEEDEHDLNFGKSFFRISFIVLDNSFFLFSIIPNIVIPSDRVLLVHAVYAYKHDKCVLFFKYIRQIL